MAPSHPLSILSIDETNLAREIVLAHHDKEVIDFREIFLQEPTKAELVKYLQLEHSGRLSPTSARPARLAKCQYDVIGSDRIPSYHECVVDIGSKQRIKHEVIGKEHQAALTL
jgi:primary-amine oxidase